MSRPRSESTAAMIGRLRWIPVGDRSGRYCSPGCGAGCTWNEYQLALKNAEALAKRLGRGWRSEGWENLGWHYAAVSKSGTLKVHGYGDGHFTAYLGEKDCAGGTYAEAGKTPQAAVRRVIEKAKAHMRIIQASLRDL